MIDWIDLAVITCLLGIGIAVGWVVRGYIAKPDCAVDIAEERIEIADNHVSAPSPIVEPTVVNDYAVDRKPRKVPWSKRKKELEAASRKTRQRVMEMRDDG